MNINELFNFNDRFGKMAKKTKDDPKAKVRNRGNVCCDNKHPKVKDNKDHFPINSESQARNAIARVNQYSSVPSWWDGSLKDLVNTVTREVKRKYKGINISQEGKEAGHKKKATFVMDDLPLDSEEYSEENNVSVDEFNSKLNMLTKLKVDHSFIYDAAVAELKDKVAAGQSFNNWDTQSIQKLLHSLNELQQK